MLKCCSHSHSRKQHKQFPKAGQNLELQLACVLTTAGCQKVLGCLDRHHQVLQQPDNKREWGLRSQWVRSVTTDSQEELSSWGPKTRPLWTSIPTQFCVNPLWLYVTLLSTLENGLWIKMVLAEKTSGELHSLRLVENCKQTLEMEEWKHFYMGNWKSPVAFLGV